MAEFEVLGQWWLPERAERRLPGRLVADPVHGAHLTLIGGALREVTDVVEWVHDEHGSSAQVGEDDLEVAGTYARILGEAEGRLFTLDDGAQVSSRGTVMGASHWQKINVRYVFEGTHFPGDHEPTATTVILRPAGLNVWVPHSAITAKIAIENPGVQRGRCPVVDTVSGITRRSIRRAASLPRHSAVR